MTPKDDPLIETSNSDNAVTFELTYQRKPSRLREVVQAALLRRERMKGDDPARPGDTRLLVQHWDYYPLGEPAVVMSVKELEEALADDPQG